MGGILGKGRGIVGLFYFFWGKSSYQFQVVEKQERPRVPPKLSGQTGFPSPGCGVRSGLV